MYLDHGSLNGQAMSPEKKEDPAAQDKAVWVYSACRVLNGKRSASPHEEDGPRGIFPNVPKKTGPMGAPSRNREGRGGRRQKMLRISG